ncbi:alpha/beta hydrolase [Companilactobacillus mishanensis]|uniref:alpha/beta hydrolase n=1 Tax=Companilactobacillus mishanensis TaxID=2486008 RepID=UPI0012981C0A|nr:alpha/beta hydrolase [Companilactobacillus mishanensis]MQS89436.1 alpha/beta hydrolase [Companilactobacillus mishanensis]
MLDRKTLTFDGTDFQLDTYFLDKIGDFDKVVNHPLAIIIPGGGFNFHSDREAQPIAMKFASEGIHAIVLHYQLLKDGKSVYPAAVQQLATTMNWLKEVQAEHQIDLDKILLVGFSAGGQIVTNYNSLMTNPDTAKEVFKDKLNVTPRAVIVGYPVIDLEAGWPGDDEKIKQISPSKLFWHSQDTVTKNSKPAFIWQTITDQTVPVRNSLLYASKLEEMNLPFELHLFSSGRHGLSLATYQTQEPGGDKYLNDQVSKWWSLCMNWLKEIKVLPIN